MLNRSGIYKIENTVTGYFYIGSAVNFRRRWALHKSDLNLKRHTNSHLQRSWNIYKEEMFKFCVVEECQKENLLQKEQEYLDLYWLTNLLYNVLPTAGSRFGSSPSDETKKKMSIRKLGHPVSTETREKTSRGNTGKVVSEETRKKISMDRKGRTISEESRQKMSEAKKGRTVSEEERKKKREIYANKTEEEKEQIKKRLITATKGKKRGPRSKETKLKISLAKRK